jgi:ferredoxin-NADP reductase
MTTATTIRTKSIIWPVTLKNRQTVELRLSHKEQLISNITTFYWDAPEKLIWRAGQYGVFYLPHHNMDTSGPERFFTISAAPHEPLAFTTRITQSSYKQKLQSLKLGDTIKIQSIGGEFILTQDAIPYIFIAYGIGITPYRSILVDIAHRQLSITANLLFQHQSQEYIFQSDIQNIQQQLTLPLTRFEHTDQLTTHLIKNLPQYSQAKFYIAGPIPVVEALVEILANNNINPDNIYCDYFEYDWSQSIT